MSILRRILQSDKNHDLVKFCMSTTDWFNEDETRSLQDLERLLRNQKCLTYIIAGKQPVSPGFTLMPLGHMEKEIKYNLLYSCRPSPFAIRELHEHWETYDENFEALGETGALTLCV